ncbi:MAG: FAD-dependent oxidoreductase [Victivallaceae bacterium]
MNEYRVDLLIVGGGTGGCAVALSSTAMGLSVIMTEETDWIGGQLTSQAVPPDENFAIETHGSTGRYREFRTLVREYYKKNYPLNQAALSDPFLNPGQGRVSKLCFEPRVGVAVLEKMLKNKLEIMLCTKAIKAEVHGDVVSNVTVKNLQTEELSCIQAKYVIDATELGDLLPLAQVEHVSGAESIDKTNEPHAVSGPDQIDNVQSFTWCLAAGYDHGGNHIIDKPETYAFWRDFCPKMSPPWSGRQLDWTYSQPWTLQPKQGGIGLKQYPLTSPDVYDLWHYRRLIASEHYDQPTDEVTLINWPQNDYFNGNIIDKPEAEVQKHLNAAKELSLSLLYWMQTEAPRPDGGTGYPGLYTRPDITGNENGLAKYPYFRESRRICALFTVTEFDVSKELQLNDKLPDFPGSVGIGSYAIDLHPSSNGHHYVDIRTVPFQIPLRCLIPVRIKNLLPGCKNIGTTHITNGCYRLHPVEWNIGESTGLLVAFCLQHNYSPRQVAENSKIFEDLKQLLVKQNVLIKWENIS